MNDYYLPQINSQKLEFPNPKNAIDEGLLAWGGDLSVDRLLLAYKSGIFPWFNPDDPILWWSPNPRLIMHLDDFKISKSLKKTIASNKFEVRKNSNFKEVIVACKEIQRKGQSNTWITSNIVDAYIRLYELGHAYSYETYLDGELVGGLYGVSIGRVFCGESMFAKVSDASKVAYASLVKDLKNNNYTFIDCQIPTAHLKSLGAKEISRDEFLILLNNNLLTKDS
jgi:leucyl/phenylalanyl-tRNA--protein transferase